MASFSVESISIAILFSKDLIQGRNFWWDSLLDSTNIHFILILKPKMQVGYVIPNDRKAITSEN
jgi:hypothetical protein